MRSSVNLHIILDRSIEAYIRTDLIASFWCFILYSFISVSYFSLNSSLSFRYISVDIFQTVTLIAHLPRNFEWVKISNKINRNPRNAALTNHACEIINVSRAKLVVSIAKHLLFEHIFIKFELMMGKLGERKDRGKCDSCFAAEMRSYPSLNFVATNSFWDSF